MTKAHVIALLACLVLASGCQREESTGKQASAGDKATQDAPPEARSAIGRVVAKAMDRATDEMGSRNLTISDDNGGTKAEITPQGDLLVAGEKIPVNERQRALLVKYRSQVLAIAAAGAHIGAQGADFGVRAAGKALRGALSGNGDQVEAEIEAEAREFEARALEICDRMPPLLESQQQLAAQLPAFKPYATMTQADVDGCRKG
jgi:hypothetical protein